MSTVPILAPDGSAWDIPQNQVAAAVKAGGKVAADMTGPDNSRWTIPIDRVHDAIRSGGQLVPSSAGTFAAASVPKPADPLQHVIGYDATGPVDDSFSHRVGNRIQQNLDAISQLPGQISQGIEQAATRPPQSLSQSASNVVSNTANAVTGTLRKLWSDYHDPANLAGDVVLGYVGGEALGPAEAEAQAAKPAAVSAPASSSTASDVVSAVGRLATQQAAKFASREIPLVGRILRTYDFLKSVGGDMHAPELSTVTDGLNELSQAVIQRINAAKAAGLTDRQAVLDSRAAGLSDVAPSASRLMGLPPEAAPSSRLMGIPQVRGFSDVQEDAGIQQGLQASLDQEGEAVRAEQAREFAARNSMDVPKWQRIVNQKVQTLLDQAEQKSTSSTQVKPYKAKAAAAAAGGDDDLTSILKTSLDIARKKRGGR